MSSREKIVIRNIVDVIDEFGVEDRSWMIYGYKKICGIIATYQDIIIEELTKQ